MVELNIAIMHAWTHSCLGVLIQRGACMRYTEGVARGYGQRGGTWDVRIEDVWDVQRGGGAVDRPGGRGPMAPQYFIRGPQ